MQQAQNPNFQRDPRANMQRFGEFDAVYRPRRRSDDASDRVSVLTRGERADPVLVLCVVTVVAGLALGGGTRSGFLGDVILQLISIPLALVVLAKFLDARTGPAPWAPVAIWSAIVLLPLLQCIPLPEATWRQLAGADIRMAAFQAAGRAPDWAPISLIPQASLLAAVGLLPPLAVFFATLLLNAAQRRFVAAAILAVALVSVFVGMAQIAGGAGSPLYFFSITNPSEAVGFFANRNHFSAFLYVSLLLASAWAVDAGLSFASRRLDRKLDLRPLIILAASGTIMFLLAFSQIMTRSRGGIALTVVAFFIIAGLVVTDHRNKWRTASLSIMTVAALAVLIFTAQFGFARLAERIQYVGGNDTRLTVATRTIEAARSYLPFGSGIATFPFVYAKFERTDDLMIDSFINHAHDDFLELWLEAGIPGFLVLAAAVAWLIRRWFVFYKESRAVDRSIDVLLPLAAFAGAGLLVMHSIVDYPLRTSAGMVLFCFCVALVVRPVSSMKAQ